MKSGLLGGTFNPPHLGHLVCAQEALGQLGLDRVVWMPVFQPPHKEAEGDPGVEAQLVARLARAHEMADVWRVERPAEQPDPRHAYPRIWPDPSTR